MPDAASALRSLPKPDLHLHALGAIRASTLEDLVRRRGPRGVPAAVRRAAEGAVPDGLPALVDLFLGLFDVVRDAADFERVAYEALADAAAGGVRYAELRFTPWSHLRRGVAEGPMFAGIGAGRRAAERDHGILSTVTLDAPRSVGKEPLEVAVAVALRRRAEGVTGIDLSGDEGAVALDRELGPLFAAARAQGLGVTVHAGEAAGPASVRGALDLYGATRIGHGTRAAEDPSLVARLAREGIVLEVCPSSNVALAVVPSVAVHPAPAFLAAGVRLTVASDDPALFRTDAAREMERLHREAGVPLADLGRSAAFGFEAAFAGGGEGGADLRARLSRWAAEARAWAAEAESG